MNTLKSKETISKLSNKTMEAVVCTKYGGPDVLKLKTLDKPVPKVDEVLIKVHAASVTRADTMMRTGKPYFGRLFLGLTKPKNQIPGTGVAGVIEAIGEDVTEFKIGDRVFGEVLFGHGTNAEYTCTKANGILSAMPDNMSFEEAAPVCDGALTDMNFFRRLISINPGQKVLINGASGSLGTAAVQLAKYYGAEVTGVCSSQNVELVKSLGADFVIDYKAEDFTKGNKQYDFIYDSVGKSTFSKCKSVLTTNGVFLSPVLNIRDLFMMLWTRFTKKKVKFSATGILPVKELKALKAELLDIIEKGALKTVIDRTYALDQIAEAHAYIDSGRKKGNVVVVV